MKHPLLIPRYKCIAPDGAKEHYPGSPFTVGQVITFTHKRILPLQLKPPIDETEYWFTPFMDNGKGKTSYCINTFELYPHLFALLPWWAERTVEEMPEYVINLTGHVIPVLEWHNIGGTTFFITEKYKNLYKATWHNPHFFKPATQQDYEAYIKTKS